MSLVEVMREGDDENSDKEQTAMYIYDSHKLSGGANGYHIYT
jgi:hypothetical protein